MENKNNIALFSLIFLVVGVLLGWLIWGNNVMQRTMRNGVHQMPNGQMMDNNSKMDMTDMMHNMTSELEDKTGDAFDKEFLSQMIVHHEGAVAMAKQVLAQSKRPELLKLAQDIIAAQTKEISMMQEWQKAWFK
jgi:uncharacterized protein (DUF305 family)